ncbi:MULTISPECIES: UbiX family flavin prenyltransferase [Aneurinibacillus]|uniref:Flavin prenyltransferase UbiX n=1 Tax=Aneurinibacillus thermoaerophilus TaxID=143495 RepID=A0A1G8BQV9_ANETH|nr:MULTISPECIES: flavin prenyltransferase UbiX [Aneurinibacillus]AMA73576.1 aromatic acid decarboxylase [Aneurinibacillus sp. XH2]MED0674967.1 UbiX family flavin prenyltransferase [Aneurinibacillus thermoaerophilus]MED0679632.1 UbiX family flavin prenyltransferase [Aneurinibacillus thermoaerophilus]MED0737370.1 UbiX family flavin prenyltransferase [Aneurinibacillus thermoaerophilus]MED0756219.1 UbiX family flavin prenyltransferase [Aneurinibacillus thermoaerophilus]
MRKIVVVGITGASGAVYGVRLVQQLLDADCKVHLIVTEAGWQVFREELDWDTSDREAVIRKYFSHGQGELYYHTLRDFTAPVASGSYLSDAMVIIPCSMGTLSGIAHGASGNLLERTADVMLKEGRKLVVVPRETPLNVIQLENMTKLARAGARIVPAMPGYYHKPKTMDDLIDFVVGKVLDTLDVPHQLFRRWGE